MELFAAAENLRHAVPVPIPSISSPLPHAAANPTPANASPLMEDVVTALEHASMSAKRLSFSAPFPGVDASEVASAIASLRNAHQVIGLFLDQIDPRPPPPACVVGRGNGDEPMGDYGSVAVEAADASSDVGEVEEGIADCGMQSKRRRKRPVPACWPAGRMDNRDVALAAADPVDLRRSAMDLVFQFHGQALDSLNLVCWGNAFLDDDSMKTQQMAVLCDI
ncbi:hypothetical protein Taro_024951 [Colocasia esculenta]|uniref:Uncharacterized protein n=1 Tax=Colocasia esculenta TaxID=4460 RepID=A0A843VG33_COLES|nr:hypothetical protein [Colocasia esculenta]